MSRQAVAISTTGDEHRLGFLETSVRLWLAALDDTDSIFITVDGDRAACDRVAVTLSPLLGKGSNVWQVGQRYNAVTPGGSPVKQGIAVNKNTGLELMMDNTAADHLYLSDDDCGPKSHKALVKHTELAERIPHSMVCWGGGRFKDTRIHYATWLWPRGVMLYSTRRVVEAVGGMDEGFGLGGHEHVEWSRRIHQHGLTPAPYVTPRYMAEYGVIGSASRAHVHWYCEDMRQIGERSVELGQRRKQITSLPRGKRDWSIAEAIMARRDGDTSYVPFRAQENGRASATLIPTSTGLGAGGDL